MLISSFASAYPEDDLKEVERIVLRWACADIVEQMLEDLPSGGQSSPDYTGVWELLPHRLRRFYTPLFLRRFLVNTVDLIGRLNRGAVRAECLADEIALHMIVWHARDVLDLWTDNEDPRVGDLPPVDGAQLDYSGFIELSVQDVDVLFLWQDEADGIEDHGLESMGISEKQLHPDTWFKPFGNAQYPPQPYVSDD